MKTDEQLLSDHLDGVSGALDELVRRYVSDLYRFVARFVGNQQAGEDIVQDTFLQVHQSAGSFDPTRRFKPWLYTIAANKARDHLRARVRRPEQTLESAKDPEGVAWRDTLPAESVDASEALSEEERAARVRSLIERLPEHLREILLLGYYQQLPYADIAEVLSIPLGTVKSRLHAAVQQFSRLWAAHGIPVSEDQDGSS